MTDKVFKIISIPVKVPIVIVLFLFSPLVATFSYMESTEGNCDWDYCFGKYLRSIISIF